MEKYSCKFIDIFNASIRFMEVTHGIKGHEIIDTLNLHCNFLIEDDLYDNKFSAEIPTETEFYSNINSYDNSMEASRRQNTSSYFTPVELTEDISQKTLKHFKESSLEELNVIDIASGSCNFILGYIRSLPKDILYAALKNAFCVDIQRESLILGGILLIHEILKITGKFFLNVKLINADSISGYELEENPDIKRVLDEGGFDIVIGNPPYLGEKGNQDIFISIKNGEFGKKYYEGKMDLFYFFIHRGIDILKEGGIISYLTTNYFVSSDGGKKLRMRLRESGDFLEIFDFGNRRLFKSAPGQHNLIFIYQKNSKATEKNVKIGFYDSDFSYEILQNNIYDDNNNIRYYRDQETFFLIEKILRVSNAKIKDRFDVKQGIVSGADSFNGEGIFVHRSEEIDKLGFEDFCIKFFYKNSDISPYAVNLHESPLSILYIDRKVSEKEIPKIVDYLVKYKLQLSKRREVLKGYIPWFGLQWPREKWVFEKEKIVVPQRNLINMFAYSNGDFFASADVYYIIKLNDSISSKEMKYLTGLLNSRLYYFWLYNMGKRKGELLEMYSTPIKEISYIKYEELGWQKKIVKAVEKIIELTSEADIEKSRNEIENYINEGYFLSFIEIEKVEKFYKLSRRQ